MAEHYIQNKVGVNQSSTDHSDEKKSNLTNFSYRKEEHASGLYDRSGRFFCRKGSWFFKTREGVDYGPYQSRVECRYAYDEFIEVVSGASSLTSQTSEYQDAKSDWDLPKINFS